MALQWSNIWDADDSAIEAVYTDLGFDGVWSLTTKLSVMSIDGLHLPIYLNYLWAVTPQDFKCPVCTRQKPQIIERSGSRVMANLSLDHDHIINFIDDLAREYTSSTNLKSLYDTYMAFTPTIMCNSCNAIDSLVKIHLDNVDKYFTFPPLVKKALFRPYRRNMHWVNTAKAQVLWRQHQEKHEQKKKEIPTALQDYVHSSKGAYGYKRYMADKVKQDFQKISPHPSPSSFHDFIKRSTANGLLLNV